MWRLLLLLTLASGCTRQPERAPEAQAPLEGSGRSEVRVASAQAPDAGDGGCASAPARALCAERALECGPLLATDSCGAVQRLSCGTCDAGQECSSAGRCLAACAAGQQRCCDGQCDAPEACAVLVCDPRPSPERPVR
jgi:hypothetical protein